MNGEINEGRGPGGFIFDFERRKKNTLGVWRLGFLCSIFLEKVVEKES